MKKKKKQKYLIFAKFQLQPVKPVKMSCHGSITFSISIFSDAACVGSTGCHQILSIADPSSTIPIILWMSNLSPKRKESTAITLEMICSLN